MSIIAAGLAFLCTPTAVWDGDGPVWCEEGPRLRIAGIAARELDGSCSAGHPCPDATAEQARAALVSLLGGQRGTLSSGHIRVSARAMRCVSTGSAGGNRTGAFCSLPDGRDLSCAMLATRTVARWERYMGGRRC
jgi:endonuclease YncB( thermonuclease family)